MNRPLSVLLTAIGSLLVIVSGTVLTHAQQMSMLLIVLAYAGVALGAALWYWGYRHL